MNPLADSEANTFSPMKLLVIRKIKVKPKPRSNPYWIAFFSVAESFEISLEAYCSEIFGKRRTESELVITPGNNISGSATPLRIP